MGRKVTKLAIYDLMAEAILEKMMSAQLDT
jgi:hypothetical protein